VNQVKIVVSVLNFVVTNCYDELITEHKSNNVNNWSVNLAAFLIVILRLFLSEVLLKLHLLSPCSIYVPILQTGLSLDRNQ